MTGTSKYDVFVSYSSSDREWVRGELLQRLESAGLRVLIDFRDFQPGAPSIKEMERGIRDSRKTLMVLTPAYVASAWCEIESVMLQTLSPANNDLRLIPLLRTSCEKPLRLGALTYVDFTGEADLDVAWQRLLSALHAPTEAGEEPFPAEIKAEHDKAKELLASDKHEAAMPILVHALAAADEAGHVRARVEIRLSLAHCLYDARDDLISAERIYREALVLVPNENHARKRSVLCGLGETLLLAGRLDEAAAVAAALDESALQSGKKLELAYSLMLRGHLEHTLGFNPQAVANLDKAIGLFMQHSFAQSRADRRENASALAICYLNKASMAHEEGRVEEALALCDLAAEQHRISEDRLDAGKALVFRGDILCSEAEWEKSFQCFQQAMKLFLEIGNQLWMARVAGRVAGMHAQHEHWQEAVQAMLAAAHGAAEAEHAGDQVHFLCEAAALVRQWKRDRGREEILRQLLALGDGAPKCERAAIYAASAMKRDEMLKAVDAAARDDAEAHALLEMAKSIAQEAHLPFHLANCLIAEARGVIPEDDEAARRERLLRATELLKEELRRVHSPKKRGLVMGRICGLDQELGRHAEALSWMHRAGEVFEKAGDVQGLASYYSSLGQTLRAQGRLTDEITAYRKALALVEGRSFHRTGAAARLSLAVALRFQKEYDEAQHLLDDAEAICEQYHLREIIPEIGACRSKIEHELEAGQVPSHTLCELLESLGQLLAYRPERSVAYLAFWYFAWKSEFLAALRSGPDLSLMVVTDDVERFLRVAGKLHKVADNFLMVTTVEPTVVIEPCVLALPPAWRFPLSFPLLLAKKPAEVTEAGEAEADDGGEVVAALPRIQLVGPATNLPPYMPVEGKSEATGEGHMMALTAFTLPRQAIDLMTEHPLTTLIEQHALWIASPRWASRDPFLTDLRVAYERGFFPVYLDRFPSSEATTVCAAARVIVSGRAGGGHAGDAERWRRALLRIAALPKEEAKSRMLDLPDSICVGPETDEEVQMEVVLFEFAEMDRRVVQPAILVRSPRLVG